MNMQQPVTHAARAAVIGSGPMGISAGYFLQRMGYRVEVFESEGDLGGMLREEVNKKRLPGEILEKQINYMKDLGIEFRTNFLFLNDYSFRELTEDGFRAVLLSTGFITREKLKLPKDMLHSKGGLKTDPLTLETKIRGLFAGGGIILGRAPIAEIIASAKKAAVSISHYLRKEDMRKDRVFEPKVSEQIPKVGIQIRKRQIDSEDFSEDAFYEEALRCMTCGGKAIISHPDDCMTCYCCELSCPSEAIYVHPFKEELTASFNY
jgi:heterodisulfide reductase subunit A-like polyferredoxin